MMKKVLLAAVCVLALTGTYAQTGLRKPLVKKIKVGIAADASERLHANQLNALSKTTALFEMDTLWYFRNKQQFKDPTGDQGYYGVYMSTGTGTNGDIAEYGCSFLNTSANSPVTISGALFLASRKSDSQNSTIPVKVTLYNASNTGVPTTKVDSVMVNVTSTGGNFIDAQFATPRTVTGSFFISYRIMPLSPLDTLIAFASSAASSGNGSAAPTEKFGDGLSYVRIVAVNPTYNQVSVTKDYLFGTGYDPEAVVVPMVSYSINPNFNSPAPNAPGNPNAYCNNKALTFTNTTNPASVVYNRQFNFNRFITYWAPTTFGGQTPPDPADPIDNWSFSTGTSYTTTNATVTVSTPMTLVTTLEIKYRHSPEAPDVQLPSVSDAKNATFSIVDCTDTGLGDVTGSENLGVYPNPLVNGKTTVSGLTGTNTILVYDMLGQLVLKQTSDKGTATIDLLNQPNGTYIVKILAATDTAKVIKVVNQN